MKPLGGKLRLLTRVMPLLAVVALVGCEGWLHRDLASVRRAMQAKHYFSGPLQIELADAVARGDVPGIEEAIRKGADIDGCSDAGMTMLVWAAVKGSLPGFKALLAHGADLTARIRDPELLARGSWRPTTIDVISSEEDKSFLRAALESGFDPNRIIEPNSVETLLYRVVWHHDLETADILISCGADVNHRNAWELTPLGQAQLIGDYKMIALLHMRGGDLTIKDHVGYDIARHIKEYGTRGVLPDQMAAFETIVAELVSRGLLTRQDIVEADKPKHDSADDGPPGISVIEHSPDSEIGRAILQMDRSEREANERDRSR